MRRDEILMLGRNEFSNFRRASSLSLSLFILFLLLSFASERRGRDLRFERKGKRIGAISKTVRRDSRELREMEELRDPAGVGKP